MNKENGEKSEQKEKMVISKAELIQLILLQPVLKGNLTLVYQTKK